MSASLDGISSGLNNPHGYEMLKNPLTNKGMSFSHEEKLRYEIQGLIPGGLPIDLDTRIEIAMTQLEKKSSALEKYIFLHTIQDADETLFYAILSKHTKTTMPLVYTPTVGQACQEWSQIYRHTPRGLYITADDRGRVAQLLENYPSKNIKVVVFTDGERILGLGDLGANGMGIPIGKLALYTTCAGIHPSECLPVHIDVGTNNEALLQDIAYMGLKQRRDRSPRYDDLVEEFFDACQHKYGRTVLMQFEDFGNSNAFRLLERYRHRANCFNDDIQGTAAVVLAGLLASLKLVQKDNLSQHRFLFLGAGEAGVGIADLLSTAIVKQAGCSLEAARQLIWFVDSQGLVTKSRVNLEEHKQHYAHDTSQLHSTEEVVTLLDAVKFVKPTALIGVSAQGGAFTEDVCREMAKNDARPVIFALSNPTTKAECTAVQAYTWTDGRCVFASGSPFAEVELPDGRKFIPGQGNNAYIFPGVGLGAIAVGATHLSDEDFFVAASSLASLTTPDLLSQGCCYPSLEDIRQVSTTIAAAVANNIIQSKRNTILPHGCDTAEGMIIHCKSIMYTPEY